MNTTDPEPSDYPIVKYYSASYANGDPSPWAQLVIKPGQQCQNDGDLMGWERYSGPDTKPGWWAL